MFGHLWYLDGIYVFVCWNLITEWYCFMLIRHGHNMALSDVDVLWNSLYSVREHQDLPLGSKPALNNTRIGGPSWYYQISSLLSEATFLPSYLFLPSFFEHPPWAFLLLSHVFLYTPPCLLYVLPVYPCLKFWKQIKSIRPLIVHIFQDPLNPSSLLDYQLCIFFVWFTSLCLLPFLVYPSIELWWDFSLHLP